MDTTPTETLDAVLRAMLQTAEGVSDLFFICGKSPQVEVHGKLRPVALEEMPGVLDTGRVEKLVRTIISGNARLAKDLSEIGSCDCSYMLPDLCRFRVNI